MWFEVDYNKLGILLLPTFLRKPRLVGYLQSLLVPLITIHDLWKEKRIDDWYTLNHTGQVCYLRKVLNDRLDPDPIDGRRIYIGEGTLVDRQYIYTHAETLLDEKKKVFLGKMFIYRRNEYRDTGVDFVVYVPQEIINTESDRLNSLIRFYKLAGKRYQIQAI